MYTASLTMIIMMMVFLQKSMHITSKCLTIVNLGFLQQPNLGKIVLSFNRQRDCVPNRLVEPRIRSIAKCIRLILVGKEVLHVTHLMVSSDHVLLIDLCTHLYPGDFAVKGYSKCNLVSNIL